MNWHDVLDVAGVVFMAGIAFATIRFQGREIQELKINDQRQDETLIKHGEALARGKLL